MRHFTIICILIFITLKGFTQLSNADAFFNGSYDIHYIREKKIKQITVDIKINGKKSTSYIFIFDKKGLVKNQIILDSLGNNVNSFFFKYNKFNDQIERTELIKDLKKTYKVIFYKTYYKHFLMSEKSSELPFLTKYFYNSLGQKTKTITFIGSDTLNSPKRIFDYSYNTNRKLSEAKELLITADKIINDMGTTIYSYDTNGQIISVKKNNGRDYIIKYDKNGFIESTFFQMPEEFSSLQIMDNYKYSFRK